MATNPFYKSTRRYDIDWLRILAVVVLFPFHTARIFDVWEANYVTNDVLSKWMTYLFVGTVNIWHMPLFFLLAGASTYFALHVRTGGQYRKERFMRLFIPFLFGLLVLLPPQGYFARLHHVPGYGESFLTYYPTFFKLDLSDLTGYTTGGFTPSHLWFILYLLVLSLAALPLFQYLRSEAGKARVGRWADTLQAKPGRIFLLALPLLLSILLPAPGGKNPFYYFFIIVYGYLMVSDVRFAAYLDRYKTPAAIFSLLMLVANVALSFVSDSLPIWTRYLWYFFTISIVTPTCLIAIVGYGQKYLNFSNHLRMYASEAAYPFYLLHHPTIMILGYFIVQWTLGPWAKFAAINILAFAITFLLYETLVKRAYLTRFLFGMKPHQGKAQPVPTPGD